MSSTLHLISVIAFLSSLTFLLISINNLSNFRRLGEYRLVKSLPRLSVLIPVRNEEEKIEKCVLSILNQDYPDFEVIVLLDNCEDKTEEILHDIAKKYKNLKIIKGQPLPEGWYGKHWACFQLTNYANGDLLLFTDADTVYKRKNTLKLAVSALIKENADLLTGLPKEEAYSFSEKLAIPFISFGIHTIVPIKLISKMKSPIATVTIGQFMLFRREVLEDIGGFESVRDEIADDIALGRKIKEYGYKWYFIDISDHVSCRMYEDLKSVFHGFGKNLFGVFNYKILTYFLVWTFVAVVFLCPIYIIALKFLKYTITKSVLYYSLGTLTALSITFYIPYNRFKYSTSLILLYPITVTIWILMAFYSFYSTIAGKAAWKGRKVLKHEVRWL
ncbi:MAG: glycosyltransferase [Candidatus Marinimicrobia bacterium]|nr:glycosyltransferase [Candidatus Neomarinimicrobiota bacterium]